MNVAMLDVRYIGIDHESDQVENEISALAKDCEGGEAVVLESHVMG